MTAKLTLVAARDLQRGIGKDNKLPWRLPAEMQIFKRLTIGKTILMGYNTAVSLGRALPKRENIVLTSREAPFDNMKVVRSLEEARALPVDELMVIGGAQLYETALPLADKICLSIINATFPADVWFPVIDSSQFTRTFLEPHPAAEPDDLSFNYVEYERRV